MNRPILTGSLTAAIFTLITGAAVAQDMRAEVMHQWTSESESAGVRVLADRFQALGGVWVDNAVAGGPNARAAAVNRVIGGQPPTAMQFNTGAQFIELQEAGLLRDLSDIAAANDWAGFMPASHLGLLTREGGVWGIPISGNGANWFWFNKSLLDDLGLETPQSWDAVFAALDAAQARGVVPFALSGEPRWERLMFNAVVLGVAGRDVYARIIDQRDPQAARGPEFRRAVETFARLRGYVDSAAPGRSWPDSANMVISGRALMTQGGTWFNGAFVAAGQQADVDYTCAIIEPDQGMVMSGDVFLFPQLRGAAAVAAQDLLIQTLTEPGTQAGFAQANGTIPILAGADLSALNPCIARAATFFNDPALGNSSDQAVFPAAVVGQAQDAITRFWNDPSYGIEAFINAYASALGAS